MSSAPLSDKFHVLSLHKIPLVYNRHDYDFYFALAMLVSRQLFLVAVSR